MANQALRDIQKLVDIQAEDDGLWFVAATAPEAYLQAELRKLHGLIEQWTEIEAQTSEDSAS